MSPLSMASFLGKYLVRMPIWLLQHSHLPLVVISVSVAMSIVLGMKWLWIFVIGLFVGLVVCGLILAALLTYLRFRFRVTDHDIAVRQGVFRVVQTNVPWSQVRAVNIRRNPVERMGKLATISIDTAGTSTAEILIPAISPILADTLRNQATVSKQTTKDADADLTKDSVYRMSNKDLLLASLCSSGAIAIVICCVFFGSLIIFCSLLTGLNFDPTLNPGFNFVSYFTQGMSRVADGFETGFLAVFEFIERVSGISLTQSWASVLLGMTSLFVVFTLVFFFLIFVMCFTSNYKLHLHRKQTDLAVTRGLLTTRHSSLSPRKIQVLTLRTNFREVLFQIGELIAWQSTSGKDHRLVIPSCPALVREKVREIAFGHTDSTLTLDPRDVEFKPVSSIYLLQIFTNHLVGLFFVMVFTLLILLFSGKPVISGLWYLMWIPASLVIAGICWRKAGYSHDSQLVVSRRGLLGYKLAMGRYGKVQHVSIKQNAIQRFTGKSTITLHYPTKSISIPYLLFVEAQELKDKVLDFVERKETHWV